MWTRKGGLQVWSGHVHLGSWWVSGTTVAECDTVLSVLWALESPLGTCRTGLGVPGPLAKHHLMTAVYFHTGVPKASYTPPEKLMAFSLTHSHSEAYVSSHLSPNYLGFHYSHSLSGHFS